MNLIFTVKILILFLFAAFHFPLIWPEVVESIRHWQLQDVYLQPTIYSMVVLMCCLGLLITPFLRSTFLRIPLVGIFVYGFIFDRIIVSITAEPFSMTTARNLIDNSALAGLVIPGYSDLILPSALLGVLVTIVLCYPTKPSFSKIWGIIPIGAAFGAVGICAYSYGRTVSFPAPYAAWGKVLVAMGTDLYRGPRDRIVYNGKINRQSKHVILIVDESVRSDALGINGYVVNNTPYLTGHAEKFINFGNAVSSWNCSRQSRVILRSGLVARQIPDINEASLRQPSIWQYAKKAGYKTVSVDAWQAERGLHSYMNANERKDIDDVYMAKDIPENERDQHFARLIPKLLREAKTPLFILVNKFGTHFPYHKAHPIGFAPFDIGGTLTPDIGDENDAVLNSYNNAVVWSVDGFFEKFLDDLDTEDTVVIYTSDHGQNFNFPDVKLTHCNQSMADVGEGLVPLIVIADDDKIRAEFERSVKTSLDRMTHFQIFPTLLTLMGYEEHWVTARYGTSILQDPPMVRRFRTGEIFTGLRGSIVNAISSDWIVVD